MFSFRCLEHTDGQFFKNLKIASKFIIREPIYNLKNLHLLAGHVSKYPLKEVNVFSLPFSPASRSDYCAFSIHIIQSEVNIE